MVIYVDKDLLEIEYEKSIKIDKLTKTFKEMVYQLILNILTKKNFNGYDTEIKDKSVLRAYHNFSRYWKNYSPNRYTTTIDGKLKTYYSLEKLEKDNITEYKTVKNFYFYFINKIVINAMIEEIKLINKNEQSYNDITALEDTIDEIYFNIPDYKNEVNITLDRSKEIDHILETLNKYSQEDWIQILAQFAEQKEYKNEMRKDKNFQNLIKNIIK